MRITTLLLASLISCASHASVAESTGTGGGPGAVAQGAPAADLHVLLEIQGMT